ncbi:tripartite motif-containing protein 16-like protein isoform X3 [Dunckerocampus dactyliophorus]|uniref:tripartite motif-containing protein 16-like protein isoform X3 n=1 Tax=Dunckerocampus dactyliophorus TaxID=161453 RepID=UPI002406972C|nr:tripartite motif-containing protein 16-like protein isoform X3 [Dunckerocampus dactyliophorus]
MAQAYLGLDKAQFSCSICLELLKDPVTITCGHSFCLSCLTSYWDSQVVCSCPHCRAIFSPRPTLGRNTLLTEMIQRLGVVQLSQGPSAPPLYQDLAHSRSQGFAHTTFDVSSVHAGRTVGEKHLEEMRKNLSEQIAKKESELQQLKQNLKSFSRLTKEAVKDASRIFEELQEFLECRRVEVKALIRAQENAEVTRSENQLHRLERQISELKKRDAMLQGLSRSQDQHQIVQYMCESFCSPVQAGENTSLVVSPHVSFGGVRTAISDMKEQLQSFYHAQFANITTAVKNVTILELEKPNKVMKKCNTSNVLAFDNRSDLLQSHKELSLTEGNRVVSRTGELQSYPDHPDRFDSWAQVMCREGLQGLCYWEAEWDGQQVALGVTYESINRKGTSNESRLGHNSLSWSLRCSPSSFAFIHDNETVSFPAAVISHRIGVFLDHNAGVLSFYTVTPGGIQLLHQIKTTFDQPLYPAVWLGAHATINLGCVD